MRVSEATQSYEKSIVLVGRATPLRNFALTFLQRYAKKFRCEFHRLDDMADSDNDTADISNGLLLEDADDNQEEALLSKTKQRKIQTEDTFEDLDVFLVPIGSPKSYSNSSTMETLSS